MKTPRILCDYCHCELDSVNDRFGMDSEDNACVQCATERAPMDVVDALRELRSGIVGGEFETEDNNTYCMANQLVLLVNAVKDMAEQARRIADALQKKEVTP